ncbi:MAG: DNA helicase RecQ [Candidatus Faecousia sp.]|nr:DNA helicase RecQ [Candidatus Faecousia sp.]
METKESILQRVFGYSAFRGGQEALIDAQLQGRDAFGIMPTGGGKSLCYQIPALLLEGVTLVISPLISLMRDQVMALKNAGVAAAYINSSLTPAQIRLVYRNIQSGMYKIIYVAPERLLTDGFLEAIQARKVSLVTVDEAHCISQWGQDFRPSYLKIVDFLNILTPRPVVSAFTATATETVRQDIAQILQLRDPLRVVTGFDRPNLRFEVQRPKQKLPALIDLVQQRRDKAGIVYCATRKAVEEVCENLQLNGIAATRYHAGLPDEERRDNQEDFLYDRKTVMVATNAFGMGIDKSNVSYVIHYNMPQSLESYYQEAGRAGRDGAEAECILLYAPGDVQTAKYLIQHPALSGELSQEALEQKQRLDLERLDVMVNYCKTQECLRGYILDYFGQEHESFCGNCSNCSTETEERDITDQARMILSCVQRMSAKLGYSLGLTSVVRTLLGSRDKRLLQLGLDKLGSYGMLRKLGKDDLRAMAENLESQGYLETDPVHGGISLTQKAQGVLFEGKTVSMRLPKAEASAPVSSPIGGGQDPNLLAMLKRLRWKIAMQESVPAYIIFSNATLEDMARKAPTTLEAFAKVNGVGSVKVKRFGEVFVDAIADYLQEHGG